MKEAINQMELKFGAYSQNEGFARTCAAAFCLQLNPTIDEITDIKTAVSEAVTNCVVHAYPNDVGEISLKIVLSDKKAIITVSDSGVGIADLDKAREPFFTTVTTGERSGMGFTVMESFMDEVSLIRNKGAGVSVIMIKNIGEAAPKTQVASV
ncbi:MAG: anti-sigma F factor [Christensenellaceae bacterium]|jgi:stage II sporulation protein AB (anti-sigma F factor)|nr:anti-sigma F factor [Christensenellaceae bacterium]